MSSTKEFSRFKSHEQLTSREHEPQSMAIRISGDKYLPPLLCLYNIYPRDSSQ